MATRGRKPGFRMSEEHRVKIQNSNILNALIEHVVGEREMSSTQVTAGLGLMRKVLPDLSNTTVEGPGENGEHIHSADETFAEFVRIMGGLKGRPTGSVDEAGGMDRESETGATDA